MTVHLRAVTKEEACSSVPADDNVRPLLACFCTSAQVSSDPAAPPSFSRLPPTCSLRSCAGASAAAAGEQKSVNFRNSRGASASTKENVTNFYSFNEDTW